MLHLHSAALQNPLTRWENPHHGTFWNSSACQPCPSVGPQYLSWAPKTFLFSLATLATLVPWLCVADSVLDIKVTTSARCVLRCANSPVVATFVRWKAMRCSLGDSEQSMRHEKWDMRHGIWDMRHEKWETDPSEHPECENMKSQAYNMIP